MGYYKKLLKTAKKNNFVVTEQLLKKIQNNKCASLHDQAKNLSDKNSDFTVQINSLRQQATEYAKMSPRAIIESEISNEIKELEALLFDIRMHLHDLYNSSVSLEPMDNEPIVAWGFVGKKNRAENLKNLKKYTSQLQIVSKSINELNKLSESEKAQVVFFRRSKNEFSIDPNTLAGTIEAELE